MEELAALTGDTVHLGTMEKNQVFYLEKIPGTRGPEMRSRVGQQMPLASTGLGKSLMLGLSP
ncbi:IclR family transcriptional regulator, partial [bacterium]|nr:IclR family transcriptional regulator [bacterium]